MSTSLSPSQPKTITVIANHNNVAIFDMYPTSGTTFVQADPSNFRALVQKLTEASRNPSNHKLLVICSNRESEGHRIPPFKLQERRQSRKNLKINLQNVPGVEHPYSSPTNYVISFTPVQNWMLMSNNVGFWGLIDGIGSRGEMGMAKASPVSTLDFMVAQRITISPITPMTKEEIEYIGIAERGYYLHPTPPGCRGSDPPELLPLFPLHHSPMFPKCYLTL